VAPENKVRALPRRLSFILCLRTKANN
jgi:hypothetical protein